MKNNKIPDLKICQSCSLPMKNAGYYGTNNDNTLNEDFCSLCWQEGRFTEPTLTSQIMEDKIVSILKTKSNVNEEHLRMAVKRMLGRLKRWR